MEDFTLAIELVDKTLGEPGVISRATVEILDDESKSELRGFQSQQHALAVFNRTTL